jgi:hypothetical protein
LPGCCCFPCSVGSLKVFYDNLNLSLNMLFDSSIDPLPQRNCGKSDRLVGTVVEEVTCSNCSRKLIKGVLCVILRGLVDYFCSRFEFSATVARLIIDIESDRVNFIELELLLMPRVNFLFKTLDIVVSPREDLCKISSSFLIEIRSPIAVDSRIEIFFSTI